MERAKDTSCRHCNISSMLVLAVLAALFEAAAAIVMELVMETKHVVAHKE